MYAWGYCGSDGMRNELVSAVTRGDSDSLVQQAFVQKYGPTVLAAPTGTGFDRTAWIMPFAALFVEFGVVVLELCVHGRIALRLRWLTEFARFAVPSSNSSVSRRARRLIYEFRMGMLHTR